MRNLYKPGLVLLIFLFGGFNLYAAETPPPIKINSDGIFIDKKNNLSHFKGHVQFIQGGLRINADSIKVFLKNDKIDRIIIEGKPAKFLHIETGEDPVKAEAQRIEYLAASEILKLSGQVKVEKGVQQFSGESIQYNRTTQQVIADGKGGLKSRVKAIITPK